MKKRYVSLGLMSGTSGDGVDTSIIISNGLNEYESVEDKYFCESLRTVGHQHSPFSYDGSRNNPKLYHRYKQDILAGIIESASVFSVGSWNNTNQLPQKGRDVFSYL